MNISEYFQGSYGTMYYVKDMNKAVQYYKDLFDLKPEDESEQWSTFNLNGHRICLHAQDPNVNTTENGILITSVRELEKVVAELKSRGVEFVQEIAQVCDGGYAADFKDPSGNVVSLFEYKG